MSEAVPPEYGGNANAAVRHALEDYVRRREAAAFDASIGRLANEPGLRRASAEIEAEFRVAELDGLPDDPTW